MNPPQSDNIAIITAVQEHFKECRFYPKECIVIPYQLAISYNEDSTYFEAP